MPLSDNMRGALWMLASVAGATAMTVLVRRLTPELHTSMIAFLRCVVGLLFLAPLLLKAEPAALLRLSRPGLHVMRGALVALALNLGFYAIWRLPVATATILFFLAPVFSTLLAPLMVGERVGARRWAAVIVGFLGALVVLRPGMAPLDAGTMAAIGSSLCFAVALLLGKTASAADGPDSVYLTTALLTVAMTLPFALLEWRLPWQGWVWGGLLMLAAASSLRGYADIRAFAAADASFVAPVSYLRLPAVALAGWLMFGESVDGWTWAGGAIIAGATLFIALRERTPRATRAAPPPLGG